jgi:hypothetical protein
LRSLRSHVVAAIWCPCCCLPPRAMLSPVPVTDSCVRASCARMLSSPSAVLAVASPLSRAMLSPVPVTDALVGCARASCARTLSPPSAVLASAARLPRAMPSPVPVTDALVGCARASCARTLSPPLKGELIFAQLLRCSLGSSGSFGVFLCVQLRFNEARPACILCFAAGENVSYFPLPGV